MIFLVLIIYSICRKDRAKAVEILLKDLKVFSAFNEDLFKEITQLLTLENFRFYFHFVNCIMHPKLIVELL